MDDECSYCVLPGVMINPGVTTQALSGSAQCFQISLGAPEFLRWELDVMEKMPRDLEPPRSWSARYSFDSPKDIFEDKFVEMSSYGKELMFSLDRHPSFANDSFWVSELYKRKECVCVCLRAGDGGISQSLTYYVTTMLVSVIELEIFNVLALGSQYNLLK